MLPMPGDLAGQFRQDALNFLALFDKQLPQRVVAVDRLHRLDEKRAAGGRHIVNQTRNRALALGFHRHDETVGANGHNRLLQKFCIRRGCDDLLQALADGNALAADFAADGRQFRACRVGKLVFGDDGGKNPLFEVFVRRDLGKEDVEVIFHALAVGIRLCLPRAFEDACHAQKLLRAQAATPDCAVHACAHITYPGKTWRTFEGNHAAGGACLLLKQPDFVCVGQRLRFEALFFPGGGTRLIGKKAKHLVKL